MSEKEQDFLELMESKYPNVKWDKDAQGCSHIPQGWHKLVEDLFWTLNKIAEGVPGKPTKLSLLKQKWNRFIYRTIRGISRKLGYKIINKLQFKQTSNYISGNIIIDQIKDKFASLRVHYSTDSEDIRPLIECAIDMAELASDRTCEVTGAPGTRRAGSWIRVLSDVVWQEIQDKKNPNKVKEVNLWKVTDDWISAIEKRFEGRNEDDLTQIFMRGPYTGLSEFELHDLAKTLKENRDNYPLND